MRETLGWRHFRVTQMRKVALTPSPSRRPQAADALGEGGDNRGRGSGSGGAERPPKKAVFLLMTASCDQTAKLWCAVDKGRLK